MKSFKYESRRGACALAGAVALAMTATAHDARAQVASMSAWEAASFRSWSFVPYWTSTSQVNSFATNRVYDHLSDVLYFSGVQPKADGSLHYLANANTHLNSLKSAQAQFGFRYHMSMFDVNGGSVETVWNSITSNAATRATFVNNVTNLLTANNMTGFNLDWERPNTVAEWANYTQLAKDMQAAFPEPWEVSVDDYGFADPLWDNSPVFDARTYDQIGMMGYHYPANNGTGLDQQSFADGKKALTGQGVDKAFKDSQIIVGMGTWGDNGPSTIGLKDIVAVNPNLPADASSFTGTVNGTTGTWDIVSRYEVRDNVQLALDRGMAGVMWWALHYEPTNKMSLARVAQHYAMFKKDIPDLTLDGKVNAADAGALADNMGTVPGWTGTNTQARFETFYMQGNWEKGDRDGNGFVNQADADWLAGRYATLGVALPDRLAYTGEFEKLNNASGVAGRWEAVRGPANQLPETGNYTQHNAGFIAFTGTGPGAGKHSNSAVTIRNQNVAEAFDALNTESRAMRAELATPIDLGGQQETFVTFLIRQNTAPLLPAQLASTDRTLALEFLDSGGVNQFDFAFRGQQSDFAIRHQADAFGEDATADGFAADATLLFVGKIAGHNGDVNTLQASLFAPGTTVGNFADPNFPWMLTAHSSESFNPILTHLQFTSLYEANTTVSNVWVGPASAFFAPPTPGDFNADGSVDAADLALWHAGFGTSDSATHWQGDADDDHDVDGADFLVWQQHIGMTTATPGSSSVPEPATSSIAFAILCTLLSPARRAFAAR